MTVAKRLMEGALWGASTGIWTALPDYIDSPRTLRVVRTLGLGGTALAYGAMMGTAIAEDEAAREAEAGEHHIVEATEDEVVFDLTEAWAAVPGVLRPVVIGAGVAAGVGVIWGLFVGQQKLDDALAGWFADRGASHPYTALGATYGAVTTLAWTVTP
ncbi:MAG: hypothetical protein Q4G43_01700 [Mobilicoccus sp.]|nr:hypothetical protein [Mobilicoccus sp.]